MNLPGTERDKALSFWTATRTSATRSHFGTAFTRHRVQVCWVQQTSISNPLEVYTTDLSAGGIGLLCPNMVYPGTIGVLLLVDARNRVHLRYTEVMHCRYLIGSMAHLIGGRWIAEPMHVPNIEVEMTSFGPKLSLGQPLSRQDLHRRRRAAAVARRALAQDDRQMDWRGGNDRGSR